MARLRGVIGRVGESITLTTKFYVNGVLFTPNSVSSVGIYTTETGGTAVTTLTPTASSTGVYDAVWSIPVGTAPGTFYDRWTWKAQADMATQIRTYSFRVDGGDYDTSRGSTQEEVPLFIRNKEIDFFNSVAKELVQRVVGQKITYYAISDEMTKTHKLYNEAVKKTAHRAVEINALVMYNDPTQQNTNFGVDTIYTIEVYLHKHELSERKIIPRVGDFIKFGSVFYSIASLVEPQIVYGQIDNKVMMKATCRVARESEFLMKK
jgi:hypothetical protein